MEVYVVIAVRVRMKLTTDQWPEEYNVWSNFSSDVGANDEYDLGEPFIDSNFNGEFDLIGGIPKFKFYDASEDLIYDAETSVLPIYPFQDGDAHYIGTIEVLRDCNNDLGGVALSMIVVNALEVIQG